MTISASQSDSAASLLYTEQHLQILDSFLLHHSYVSGYILSRKDLNLHKALLRQYPQFSTSEGLHKGQTSDASLHNSTFSTCPHTLPHVRRWAGHIASITEAEEASLPLSDETIEEVFHAIMGQVKARTMLWLIICVLLMLFLWCGCHCRLYRVFCLFLLFIFPFILLVIR